MTHDLVCAGFLSVLAVLAATLMFVSMAAAIHTRSRFHAPALAVLMALTCGLCVKEAVRLWDRWMPVAVPAGVRTVPPADPDAVKVANWLEKYPSKPFRYDCQVYPSSGRPWRLVAGPLLPLVLDAVPGAEGRIIERIGSRWRIEGVLELRPDDSGRLWEVLVAHSIEDLHPPIPPSED